LQRMNTSQDTRVHYSVCSTLDIETDREVLVHRRDIIIKNKTDKFFLLIDVSISSQRKVIQKEAQNKLKYVNVSI
jgi:hypothetical protein